MSLVAIIRSPDTFSAVVLEFITWYFIEMPLRILKSAWAYILTLNEIFSFLFLVRTFFSPWKSITDAYPRRGIDLGAIAQAFTLNTTSRVIGMVFRGTAFIMGVTAEAVVLAVFTVVFVFWIFFPVLFVLDIFYLFEGIL